MLSIYPDRRTPSRRYCIGKVESVNDIPAALEPVSPHFMLFLAMDATSIRDESLQNVARKLTDRGMAYLCVWGNDCSRVHDQFDLERDPDEPEDQTVTTTWHLDEPLSEALWYFANVAFPDDSFEADCTDWVAFSISNSAWEQEIRKELIDRNEDGPP